MRCRQVMLVNVRNYRRLELDLPAGAVVIHGDNGQGKSNLLEAVYVLATSKSYRTSQDRDLLNWSVTDTGAEPATAFARFASLVERSSSNLRLEVIIAPIPPEADGGEERGRQPATLTNKRILVNGTARRSGDLVGQLHVVLFTPADLDLVTGSPDVRRRYLNVTLSQTDRAYYRALVQYNRVITQRNSLLRHLRETRDRRDQLTYWNDELVRHGSYITSRRADAVLQLGSMLEDRYTDLTGDPGLLHLGYVASVTGDEPVEPVKLLQEDEAARRFRTLLARQEAREIQAGVSLHGPHRDDVSFMLQGRDLSRFGSRGQQRAATVGLKLAEVAYMRQVSGEMPVMLLDDVLSELDRPRRDYLTRSLPAHQQVLLTTADLDVIPEALLQRSVRLHVQAGTVTPQ